MKFLEMKEAKEVIPDGVLLTSWLRDNLYYREMLEKFYCQVMKNKNRKACYVSKGGLIALFVNDMSRR